jgi:hypothetical protein
MKSGENTAALKLHFFPQSAKRGNAVTNCAATNSTTHVSLAQMLEKAVPEGQEQRISLREIMEGLGTRSYGPLLFFFCLFELLPFISAIPGMYIVTASVVILLSAQLMIGREQPWLPAWLLNVSLSRKPLRDRLQRWSAWTLWLDGMMKPRLEYLVDPPFVQGMAGLCIVFALAFFPLSPIPASEKVLVVPVAFFALALMTRDGVLAIVGFLIAGASIGGMIYFWGDIWRAGMKALEYIGL